jgi:hypothetical protein
MMRGGNAKQADVIQPDHLSEPTSNEHNWQIRREPYSLYDPAEATRNKILWITFALLGGVILLGLASLLICAVQEVPADTILRFLEVVFPLLTASTGGVIGFYFGRRSISD